MNKIKKKLGQLREIAEKRRKEGKAGAFQATNKLFKRELKKAASNLQVHNSNNDRLSSGVSVCGRDKSRKSDILHRELEEMYKLKSNISSAFENYQLILQYESIGYESCDCLVERCFHPVGQGAFYSEKHRDFNVVYDCGNWKDTKGSTGVVKKAFKKGEKIDALFVSHFDFDHVSKINVLRSNNVIDVVFLPDLHKNEKTMLINFYNAKGFPYAELIDDPKRFFGPDVRVVFVKEVGSNYDHLEGGRSSVYLDDFDDEVIDSGTIIKKYGLRYDWAYIPYNHKYDERSVALENSLENVGIDIDAIRKDSKYALSMLTSKRKLMRGVYNELEGRINSNSMLVYSGPVDINSDRKYFIAHTRGKERLQFVDRKNCKRVACIFTGDSNLREVNIKDVFSSYWGFVGTIQVPHHGDYKSFDSTLFGKEVFHLPISVGSKNSYGHPSPYVINDIVINNCIPHVVNEFMKSTYTERIFIRNE